jgi:hypothetical protein
MSAQELPATVAPGLDPDSTSRPAPSDARPQRPADTHLRLRGLTDDGTRLLLVDHAGLEFTVNVDARLRAALHGDPSRTDSSSPSDPTTAPPRSGAEPTTREKTMESILRPRDIQARIRAGETPEAVAEAAQTTLEKVMPYAAPVLAEREHVAQRALRASIRRPAASDRQAPASTSRTLGEAISTRLRGMNVDPDTVLWDAWRREDGRWSLTASFSAGGQDGLARLTYDQPGNFVLLDNDEARWLVGDHIESGPAEPVAEPEPSGWVLSSVPSEQLALTHEELGTDAIDLVSDQPIEAYLDVQATEATAEIEAVEVEPPAPAADEPTARPPAKKKRASVPSWDEIMFGGADQDSDDAG